MSATERVHPFGRCSDHGRRTIWEGSDIETWPFTTLIGNTVQGRTYVLTWLAGCCRKRGRSEDDVLEGLIHGWLCSSLLRARAVLAPATEVSAAPDVQINAATHEQV